MTTATLSGTIASSWERLANASTEPCKPFPYSSRTGTMPRQPFAEFTKPLDFQTKSQALWTTTFVVGGAETRPPPPSGSSSTCQWPVKLYFDPLRGV